MKLARIAAVVATLLVFARPVVAQDAEEPGPNAAVYLLDASVLGEGWQLVDVINPNSMASYDFEMTVDVFREGAAGLYVGPNGGRAIVVVLLLSDNRSAIRKSWEDATELYDSFHYRLDDDYERIQQLEGMDPPAGCIEAKRYEGTDFYDMVPGASTMCAVDPDLLFIVSLTGSAAVGGEVPISGVAASDALVEAIVAGVE